MLALGITHLLLRPFERFQDGGAITSFWKERSLTL